MNIQRIGLIGYGEVGKIFSAGLKDKPGVAAMAAWDVKLANPANPATQAAELAHADMAGITAQLSARAVRCERPGYFCRDCIQYPGRYAGGGAIHSPRHDFPGPQFRLAWHQAAVRSAD